jgi:hypothetical protein
MYGNASDPTTKVEFASVVFNSRETLSGWNVPSGWKIATADSVTSITTPMPADENTIGPQTEGSGEVGSAYDDKGGAQSLANPRGDAFTTNTYGGGFTIEFDFKFERNTSQQCPDAYIQRDANRDEKFDGNASRKMDMFGNSGVKFFGEEILIFDIVKMIAGLSLGDPTVPGQGNEGLNPDVTIDEPNPDPTIKVVVGKIHTKTKSNLIVNGVGYASVRACNVINGNIYTKDDDRNGRNNWYAMKNANNKQTAAGEWRRLKIDVTQSVELPLSYHVAVTLSKTDNTDGVDGYVGDITVDSTNTDRHVFLQSHWGSGVTFNNISIAGK